MKTNLCLMALAAVTLLGRTDLLAQRRFDPKTVETLSGTVVSVDRQAAGRNANRGIHLTLQTEKETISVHLGPAWFMDKQKPRIDSGDKIGVTGSRVTFDGRPAIVAAEIRKGDEVLKLRDQTGVPVWSGRGPGSP